MNKLTSFYSFIIDKKMYMILLVIVLVLNVAMSVTLPKEDPEDARLKKEHALALQEKYSFTPSEMKTLMAEKSGFVLGLTFLTFLVMFLFFAGLILDAVFLFGPDRKAVFSKGPLIKTGWGPWDVCRVVILFSFFAYVLIIIESGIVSLMPSLENKKYLIMMLNSTVMDFLAIAIVLRIALVEYKERLRSLGLSMANFIKHIGIGIIGYITALPVIIGALVFTMWITKLLKYTPPMEPVVKLFLEEKSLLLLMYSAVFAIVFGPICEEIFFRGFMYPALKKRMGALMSIICTAFLFSVLHTNAVGFLPIMVLGVLLAYLYEKTGSLVPSIGVHVIHNAGMMLLVFLTKGLRA